MSMREYGFWDYGVVIPADCYISVAEHIFNGDPGEEFKAALDTEYALIEAEYALIESGSLNYMWNFTGGADPICEDGSCGLGGGDEYDDDTVVYLELPRLPSLFEKAYDSMSEIVSTIKQSGILPDDFNIRDNIRFIYGTYCA